MNLDEEFIYRFEKHELLNYIIAKRQRPLLEEEYRELEQQLYDDIGPSLTYYDYEIGRCYKRGFNVENYAILIADTKAYHKKVLDKLKRQEELFDLAMSSLTPRERDVVTVVYFNKENDLGLSVDFFNEVLQEAQAKLCSFIGEERRKQLEEQNEEYNQQLKKQIDEWKRGRIVS